MSITRRVFLRNSGLAVVGTAAVGMVPVPTGGGVTPTRMLTDLTVGNSDKQKNPEPQMNADSVCLDCVHSKEL